MKLRIVSFMLCLLPCLTCDGSVVGSLRTVPVANDKELAAALSQARPGDEIVIQDGSYHDWDVNIPCSGTASNRILIRAATPGQVVLSGGSRMRIAGDYVTVSGLCFKDGQTNGEIWQVLGSYDRITDSALMNYKDGRHKWIRVAFSKGNRLDHNAILGKTESDVTLQIDVSPSEELNRHQIDHNYFGPRPKGTGNGWETVRNGYSRQQNNPAYNLFEYNLFHECDGENEIISSKSSHNTYRYNTFRNCGGELTLRHGKYNLVQGNFFFGDGKSGSAGIRIIGEGNRVVNNYIENTRGIGIQIYEGQDDAQPTGYQATNDVLIAFNTIVRNTGNGINVKDYPRTPKNIIIANNLVVGNPRAVSELTAAQLAESYSFFGNLAYDNVIGIPVPQTAFKTVNCELVRDSYGVLRPRSDSPAIGAAATGYMDFGFNVDTDLDGQTRPADKKDVGADQVNGAGKTINRPLDANDVGGLIGPSWMKTGTTRQASGSPAGTPGQAKSPTDGFVRYEAKFYVQNWTGPNKTSAIPLEERYSQKDGIYTTEVHAGENRVEMRWDTWENQKIEHMLEADVMFEPGTNHTCIMQIKSNTGGEPIYIQVCSDTGDVRNDGANETILKDYYSKWFNLKAAFDPVTGVARAWINDELKVTRQYRLNTDGWYFKTGTYNNGVAPGGKSVAHFRNIKLWVKSGPSAKTETMTQSNSGE